MLPYHTWAGIQAPQAISFLWDDPADDDGAEDDNHDQAAEHQVASGGLFPSSPHLYTNPEVPEEVRSIWGRPQYLQNWRLDFNDDITNLDMETQAYCLGCIRQLNLDENFNNYGYSWHKNSAWSYPPQAFVGSSTGGAPPVLFQSRCKNMKPMPIMHLTYACNGETSQALQGMLWTFGP